MGEKLHCVSLRLMVPEVGVEPTRLVDKGF